MNNIILNQNKSENLLKLAAQRQLYSEAKKFFIFQILITVPVTIILSFLKIIPIQSLGFDIVPITAFFGAVITIADLLIGQFLVSNYRRKAALIQEDFDCDVYEMNWDRISVGNRIGKEVINEFGNKYVKVQGSPLTNWYPIEIADYSKERAIFICQKTNLHYDRTLRNRYITAVIIASVITLFIITFSSIVSNPSFDNFMVQIFAPFLPILILTLKITIEHFKSIKTADDLQALVSSLSSTQENPNLSDLRLLQNKIFQNRKESPLVPDFIYNKLRQKLEDQMHINAK